MRIFTCKPPSLKMVGIGLAIVIMLSLLGLGAKVGATGNNITGTVRDPSNSSVNGAFVYATAVSSSTPLYGPVTTNSSGAYTLVIPVSGTYDIHIDPPSNTGFMPYTDSSASITSDQVINYNFTALTRTFSGTLTDDSSNPLSGVTVKIFKGSSQYTATTNGSGAFSISAPAGYYYLYLNGSMTGISAFTLTQNNTSSLNLLTGDLTLNLTIHTATMTITAHNNAGGLWTGGGSGVSARATAGITSLYPGDPGTGISIMTSNGFSGSSSGTITTIVGATYAASGLESSSSSTSICLFLTGSSPTAFDCLRLPLTVTSNVSFDLPVASSATRTFSGTLTDSSSTPIAGATVTLIKYGDTSTSTTTDASGNFTINTMPKKYYLKISGSGVDGMSGFTLTQSSTNPSIDLTSTNVTQNLQINTATLTVTANDGSGNPNPSTTVNAQTSSGSTTLYTGDPGEAITLASTGFSTSPGNYTGTIGTIVGAHYNANGLHTTNTTNSLCDLQASPYWHCLTTAYTVSGSASLNVPF